MPGLAILLFLQLCTWAGVGASAAPPATRNSINCSSQVTEACIISLLEEELFPLKQSLRNASSFNYAIDEGVRAYHMISDKVTSLEPELSHTSLMLPQLYSIGNSILQKVNYLYEHLTSAEQVNKEWSIGLLLEQTSILLRHIEMNASLVSAISVTSLNMLDSLRNLTAEADHTKMDLIVAIHRVQSIVTNLAASLKTTLDLKSSVAFSKVNDSVLETSLHLATEQTALLKAQKALGEIVWLGERINRLGLPEINRSLDKGKTDLTRAEENEQDILKERAELVEVESAIELLLNSVERITRNISVIDNVTAQNLQDTGRLLNMTTLIIANHEEYRKRLEILESRPDTVIVHAINLGQLTERIQRRGEKFLDTEYANEFDRISVINSTVYKSLDMIQDGISQVQSLSVPGLALKKAIRDGRVLAKAALNITIPSISRTKNQLKEQSIVYTSVSSTYLNVSNTTVHFDLTESTIQNEVSHITQRLTDIKRTIQKINGTIAGVSSMIPVIDVEATTTLIRNKTSAFAGILSNLLSNTSEVAGQQQRLQYDLQNVSLRVENRSISEIMLNESLNHVVSLVADTLYLIDQMNYPLEFKENSTILAVRFEDLMSGGRLSTEFRSLAVHFSPSSITNSVLLHIVSYGIRQALTELVVEMIDEHIRVTFRRVLRRGTNHLLSLSVSDITIVPNTSYSLFISRTGVNVHIELREESSPDGRVSLVDRASSSVIRTAFTSASFLSTASLHVTGSSPQFQDNRGKFRGCVGLLVINNHHFNLWNLSLSGGVTNISPCSGNFSGVGGSGRGPILELGGWEYARQGINGSFLPVAIEFKTLLPNGLLLYSHSSNISQVLNSCSVYLDQGKIEVRLRSGDRQRTLTSSQTYNNGVLTVARVELDNNRLVLRTRKETVRKRLGNLPSETLSTYSELLVGGVGEMVRETEGVDQSNFTGCISVYSVGATPKTPSCFGRKTSDCSYCSSNEVALMADFYGPSYVVLPAIRAREHFDISFKFQTHFGDGILLFSGSAIERMWFAVVLNRGRLLLFVQTSLNSPFSLPHGGHLADNHLHTVTIIRSGSNLCIKVDDLTSGNTLDAFASLLPTGAFSSPLFIGGIPSSYTHLLHSGLTRDGFKGHIRDININGRALDFSKNLEAIEATLVRGDVMEEGSSGQNGCEFHFSGLNSYAEYDVGRFPDEFSLGFQFFTESDSGLLFYIFSRRRTDKMAVQLNDSSLQLYIQDTRERDHMVSVQQQVSLRQWHDVRLTQHGNNISISLDGNAGEERVITLQQPLRTTSPLYIGGLPSNQRVPTTDSVVRHHFTGCMRSHQLSLSSIRHQVQSSSCQTL